MKATSLRVGLSLAVAGAIYPMSAFAQAAPAAPAPAPAAAAPAPAAAAPAGATMAAPATAPAPAAAEPAPAPAPAPAELAPAPAPAEMAPAAPPPAEAVTPAAPAEAPPPLATVAGYIDGAFHMELNRNSIGAPPPFRAYDTPDGFLLHAAHVAVSHSFSSEASAFVSLDFGSDAILNSVNYGANPVDVREGYLKWTPGDLTFQAGKFVTLNGIEVVDGPLNPTITRGYLFTLAEPVGHTGFKLNYALAGGLAHIGAGLVNGWDLLIDNNNQKTVLFNADVIPSDTFHAQVSGSWGAEETGNDKNHRFAIDLTGAAIFGGLTLNFQGNVGTESGVGVVDANGNVGRDTWFGFGVQPVYVMDAFSLGLRGEFFNDKANSRLGPAAAGPNRQKTSLLNLTITPGYTVTKNILLRFEYRLDVALASKVDDGTGNLVSDKKLFPGGKSTDSTIAFGASYMF